jgi:hypothetical protein
MIFNSISKSKKMAALNSRDAQLLYTWILTHLDVNGNFNGEPEIVKAYVVPMLNDFTVEKVKTALNLLEKCKLIKRYDHKGETYLNVTNWKQPGIRREKETALFPVFIDKKKNGQTTDGLQAVYGRSMGGLQAAKGKVKEVKGSKNKGIGDSLNFVDNFKDIKTSLQQVYEARGYENFDLNDFGAILVNKKLAEGEDIVKDFEMWLDNNPSDKKTINILDFLTKH